MAKYITARHMSGGSKHEHIAKVKWENRSKGTTGEKTRTEMVKWIEQGGDVRVANGSSYVEVRVVDATPKYIQTYADGICTDDLLALPE